MLKTLPLLIVALSVAPHIAGAVQVGVSSPTVTRLGSRDAYGPGIVEATSRQLRLELTRPAHVIVLRVDPDGSIQLVSPESGEGAVERPAGQQIVEMPPASRVEAAPEAPHVTDPVLRTADALAREGRRARPSATGSEEQAVAPATAYWLLIVSDVPTSAADVEARLESMNREFPTMKAELEGLTRALIGRRTRQWAAFYTPARP
jgi:hypothetical protein